MRFRSLKTFHSILHQEMSFHSYIGLPVSMTSLLLLKPLPSNLPCLRQPISIITIEPLASARTPFARNPSNHALVVEHPSGAGAASGFGLL